MSRLRVLLVDDEPLARRRLRALCAGVDGVEVAGECADGPAAIERLRAGGIDLVLLDIGLPGCGGLEVVRAVGPERMPLVVFVTAHGDHALEAFELCALDYLLKPFDRVRFEGMLARVRARLQDGERVARLERLLAETQAPPEPLVLRAGGRTVLADPREIEWVEAADNYLRIHLRGREALVRATLREYEARLAPHGFLRIHRSLLVHPRVVRELSRRPGGEVEVRLEDGTVLVAARAYRRLLAERWRR
ncbi:MAG TPA: LytTR family DNA-binding domain-containing protein [Planctomycetota bacterium]